MNAINRNFLILLALLPAIFGFISTTDAQSRRGESEMRSLVRRIEVNFDTFKSSVNNDLSRNRGANSSDISQMRDDMRDFSDDLDNFKNRLNQRAASKGDAEDLLQKASGIENFVRNNQISSRAVRDWQNVHSALDSLASEYQIDWDWTTGSNNDSSGRNPLPDNNNGNNGDDDSSADNDGYSDSAPRGNRGGNSTSGNNSGGNRNPQFRGGLTGTYRIDSSRSDNPAEAAERAAQDANIGNDERDDLTRRLESPEKLALEVRGRSVSMASSLADSVTFEADGRERTEQTNNGGSLRVRADISGEKLTVMTTGDRENDYSVTFEPTDNGRSLRVTRRISTDFLRSPVKVESIYTKTSDSAQLDIFSNPNGGNDTGNTTGDFIVANDTKIVALLQNTLSTKTSIDNDRFSMLVQSPSELRGAVIEGYISNVVRSGKVTGSAKMTFNFQRIRTADGSSYDFAGFVEGMKTMDGKIVKIDNEGTLKSDSQTKKTAKRGAIGAGLGAIIGAIAGGPKGAIIGATIGGAGGAGTVAVQDKQDLELSTGSEISIRATAPRT